MPEFLVPCNLLNGNESGSPSGVGAAIGQTAIAGSGTPAGVDAFPPLSGSTLGQLGFQSIAIGATDVDGDDAFNQPAAFRRALSQLTLRGSGGVTIQRNGAPLFIANCSAVFGPASARYWVDPSDIGLGPFQIPPTPATLMLSQLEPHPSVFCRRPQQLRGIASQVASVNPAIPLIPIQQAVVAACPVEVFMVMRPPTHSGWVLSIDGLAIVVVFPHPPGSNFRRPVEVYREVVGPAIANANANGGAIPIFQVATSLLGANEFTQRGLLARLSYCEYARFVGPLDKSTIGMLVPVYLP